MKYKITGRYSKNNKDYVIYKFFKEGYEIKRTGEIKNFKFNTLKEVNAFLRKEGLKNV